MPTPIKSLKFMAIDCQAMGNNPKTSSLLEFGWLIFNLDAFLEPPLPSPRTFLLSQPEGTDIPIYIQKLTGISPSDFDYAVSADHVLSAFYKDAGTLARKNHQGFSPAVIHFARYEMPFIGQLRAVLKKTEPLPLEVICTHQIAARLMPELPRKGLRAVAGYLGHSVPPLKRCAAHLNATAHIWCHMAERLATQAGIHTWEQLQEWLKHPFAPAGEKRYPMPRQARLALPDRPGVYRMKRRNGDVLYIGKAGSLKQRVNSYFHKSRRHPEHVLEMLSQAVKLDFDPTDTAVEASLAETDAIKACDPPYNIALTKKQRKLLFISKDLSRHASSPSSHCPLGPVPSKKLWTAARALCRQLNKESDEVCDIPRIMALPAKYCPDQACFADGMQLFVKTNDPILSRLPIERALLSIGRSSWLQKLKDAQSCPDDLEDEQAQDSAPATSGQALTPEAVARTLESICRRCGFLLRRARWFYMLSDSVVVWRTKGEASDGFNALSFKNGQVDNRLRLETCASIPQPPVGNASGTAREAWIDLETYDRLRVLTTEIRRLLTEQRFTCIRLNRRVYLYGDQMSRLLKWI